MTPKKPFPRLPYPKPKRLPEKRFMTVCVAALAAESRVIVCVSDKALSYGDAIQWDSDGGKMISLNPSGTGILFAGTELGTSRILAAILAREADIGENLATTKKILEDEYKQTLDELIESLYLTPRLITRTQYLAAISSPQINPYIKSVADEIDQFNTDCELLVCGKDENNQAYIFDIDHPGVAIDMTKTGFHAIGSGAEKAISRLLFSEHKRSHTVQRVLYDLFDAKAFAEMQAGVGYEWDAQVVSSISQGSLQLSDNIKKLVERAWAHYNRSPFDAYNKDEDLEPPPEDWKQQLEEAINGEVMVKLYKMEQEQDAKSKRQSASQTS